MKSANQMWKAERAEGRTTLDFKSWLEREKTKAFHNLTENNSIPANRAFNDSIQTAVKQLQTTAGLRENTSSDKYVLGVDKRILIGIGVVAAIGIFYVIYKKTRP